MGLHSSKAEVPPSPPPPPALSLEVIEEMCKEAYAAGAGDADVYGTAQREAMQQQDALLGTGACLLSAWLAFVYGRTSGTRFAETAAAARFEAQQAMLEKVNRELVAAAEENKNLTSLQQEQQAVITQQRSELQRAARHRMAMQQSVQVLRRRNTSVRRQLRGVTHSLHAIQRQLYIGVAGTGVALLAVMWTTRPLRRGRRLEDAASVRAAEHVAAAAAAEGTVMSEGDARETGGETSEVK